MSSRGKLVVISGPSGAGKSTIAAEVVKRTGAEFSISATTRPPRPAEVDGRDYRFVDGKAFDKMVEAGQFLEWAEVFGHMYGTPAAPVQKALAEGKTIVLDVDVQGGKQVHDKVPSATFVLVVPPSPEELARRLGRRGTEQDAQLLRRLAKADEEVHAAQACGVYNHVVVNDDLEQAIRQVVQIVQR